MNEETSTSKDITNLDDSSSSDDEGKWIERIRKLEQKIRGEINQKKKENQMKTQSIPQKEQNNSVTKQINHQWTQTVDTTALSIEQLNKKLNEMSFELSQIGERTVQRDHDRLENGINECLEVIKQLQTLVFQLSGNNVNFDQFTI
jgi:hypothetical protein